MEVWAGTIASAQNPLRGVKLINSTPANACNLAKSAKLSVHSLVNPNLIPLYGRTGASLEVHISDLATSQWLRTRLLSGLLLGKYGDAKAQPIQQCPVGALINVKASRNVTDILIYGVISTRAGRSRTPPTQPLRSETHEPETQSVPVGRELRIYGIPLNSDTIINARTLATPPASPPSESTEKKDGQYAEFLPNQRPLSPKRKRVNTLFEAATQHHRRVRRKGGEAVSQLMAGGNPRPEAARLPERGLKREASDVNLHDIKDFKSESRKETSALARERGRSISIASEGHALGGRTSRDPTPTIDNLKSHHLSISNRGKKPRPSVLDSFSTRSTATPPPRPPSLAPEPTAPAGSQSKTIAENKDLLTRTILTCMRLYGYNRNAKRRDSLSSHSRSSSFSGAVNTRPTTPAATPAIGFDEDGFKSMYHATYRASTFALRRYLNPATPDAEASSSIPRLEKEKAMSMVDEFLKLFCQEDGR